MTQSKINSKKVLVCQNRTCKKQGSRKVLEAFLTHPVPGITVVGSGCLGQCGNGPMVLIEPEQVWYWRVRYKEVPAVVKRHLQEKNPVKAMLYPKFHKNTVV